MFLGEEEKSIIVELLVNELGPKFIYLFGSYGRGEGRIDSDIDLAVYMDKKVTPYELFMISNKLALVLKRDVDLINLRDISTVFAAQIVSTRDVLYCKDDYLRQVYDMRTLKEYSKLNEERKLILESIREDGVIYGK